MTKLQRKLGRDLAGSKGLFAAVALVIFLGVALFGASFLGYRNLRTSYDYSYEKLRFADFTVKVVEAPSEVTAQLKSIPGVEAVTGRMNADIPLTLPGEKVKRVIARVISLPTTVRPAVNDVKIEEGSYFEGSEGNVLLVEKNFAEHHGLRSGNNLSLIVDNHETDFKVAGIVTSPEYIWPAKSRQEILASSETFGVVFIGQETLTDILATSSVNEFCFLIDEGADRDSIIAGVEETLKPWNVVDVVTREEQPSNAALSLDLQEFGEMAEVFPLLFLIVGALATYILLTRIVQNQRAQIGLMRAIGYSRRQILLHYLSFALIIGLAGSVAGVIAGYFLGGAFTNLYVDILGLPYTRTRMGLVEWLAIEEGLLAGILPCLIAGIIAAHAASRLRPAEAMRTPPPAAGRRPLLERLLPCLTRLSFLWKIPLRNIFRNRRRSVYTIIGVAFGITLVLVSAAFIDSFDSLFSLQFDKIQTSDAQINFAQPQPATLADDVATWEEVEKTEPLLKIPAQLKHKDAAYSTLAIGLSPESDLCGLYLTSGERVRVGDGGILLSEPLEDVLGVHVGDAVTVLSPPFASRRLVVTGFVKQPMGSFGYVTLNEAQTLAGGQPAINGLMLHVDPADLDSIREQARQLPGAPSVELTREMGQEVNEMMSLLRGVMYVMLASGAALSLAIVFTTATISILERRREIATMRTLGERKGRIAAMITIENLILGLAGAVPGIPLAYVVALFMMSLFQTDMMTFHLAVYPRTYALVFGLVVFIMLVSQLPGIRDANRLDLARVIKEQAT